MKDKKLKVGMLCTVIKSDLDPSIWYKSDKSGHWVVTAIIPSTDGLSPSGMGFSIRAFSLTHQHDCWFHPTQLVPVVKSGA